MFEARFERTEQLQAVFQGLQPFKDCSLQVTKDGIRCRQLGPALITMIDMHLDSQIFTHYRYDYAEPVLNLAFSVDFMHKICCKYSNDAAVTMRWNEQDSNQLSLVFSSSRDLAEPEDFVAVAPLITFDPDPLDIPERIYDVEIDISSGLFANTIDLLDVLGPDLIVYTIDPVRLEISARDTGGKAGKQLFTNGRDLQWRWNSATGIDNLEIGYAKRSIKDFTKAKQLTDLVTLKMSDGAPMCLSYGLGTASYMSYYLAPKDL